MSVGIILTFRKIILTDTSNVLFGYLVAGVMKVDKKVFKEREKVSRPNIKVLPHRSPQDYFLSTYVVRNGSYVGWKFLSEKCLLDCTSMRKESYIERSVP